MNELRNLAMALVALAALAASDANAQYPGGQTRRGMSSRSAGEEKDSRATIPSDTPANFRSRVQLLLDQLEEDLRISAAQQRAWDTYAERIDRAADDIARERFAVRSPAGDDGDALAQFDRIAQTAQRRVTALQDIVEAGRALYATLDTGQRQVADHRLVNVVRALASGGTVPIESRRADRPQSASPPRTP